MESILRPETSSMHVLILLLVGFGLLSVAILLKPGILGLMIRSFFRIEQKSFSRESVPLLEAPGIILFLNYLVSITLLFQFLLVDMTSGFQMIFLVPMAWIIWTFFSVFLVGATVGESRSLGNYYSISLLSYELTGVLLWFAALLYSIYPDVQNEIWFFVFTLFCLDIIWRYLKIAYNLHVQGLSWYYLILYFCTLEIVPLSVVYYILLDNFV